MICASFVRPTQETSVTVEDQNERIKDYCQTVGLSVSIHYVDDCVMDENGTFNLMKQDGISGKYDCIAFDSMQIFGKNYLLALDLLKRAFVPIGIHFIFVDDQFCSFEHTRRQIGNYLSEKRKQYLERIHHHIHQYRRAIPIAQVTKYGYLRVEGKDELIIDEEVRPVVERIFDLALNGMTYSKISTLLNEENVKSAATRLSEIYGKFTPKNNHWGNKGIFSILSDSVYSGEWNFSFEGKTKIISCPAYISKEKQQLILEKYQNRRVIVNRQENPFRNYVFDKETGERLASKFSVKYGHVGYRFFEKRDQMIKYKTCFVSVSDIQNALIDKIKAEKQAAQEALNYYMSIDGKQHRDMLLSDYKEKGQALFKELVTSVSKLPVGKEDNDDFRFLKEEIAELDRRFLEIADEYEKQKAFYTKANPWIRLYLSFNEEKIKSPKEIKRYLNKVVFDKFGNFDIVLNSMDSKIIPPGSVPE